MKALPLACALVLAVSLRGGISPTTPDIPAKFTEPTAGCDYTKREVMIPMRDGVRLHTVIVVPAGAHRAPILLTRTPYNASAHAGGQSPLMTAVVPLGDRVFAAAGYICVFQDVRGKDGSEGRYFMTRPARGPLNPGTTDETTDAWDTIDWLVKHVPETNGRVGMIGSSYEGYTVAMALLDPHPALKVAAPESPMVDGWMGDDWFHYGAFRQTNLDYIAKQTEKKEWSPGIVREGFDDYENFRRAGSAGDFARAAGLDQLPWWQKIVEHPAYDSFWRGQAVDRLIAARPLTVPTMWLQGLWDQEDMWGAVHCYAAWEPKDPANTMNYLVLGPWRHSQVNYEGYSLGPLRFDGDTCQQFRRDVLKPFFDQYLVDGAPRANTPPVLVYNTGDNHWDRFSSWPLRPDSGWTVTSRPLYLQAGLGLGFDAPGLGAPGYDQYVSDPAKPVPYIPRPMQFENHDVWTRWLVSDQRAVEDRPDVLAYETAPLTKPLRVSGAPVVHLVASTSGTDSDWVVKLIDVYPDQVPSDPGMGGYELAIGMDIFRGRYRTSFEHPAPLASGVPLKYTFGLPNANHVFLPGHRIMVQIQSTWFPLYDRNPQTYVPNIFLAKPGDYQKATQRIYHSTYIDLPVAQHNGTH